jgi:hypothetical protein
MTTNIMIGLGRRNNELNELTNFLAGGDCAGKTKVGREAAALLKGRVFKIQKKSRLAAAPSQRRFALARIIVCCSASIVAHFARKVRATNT